MYSDRDEGTGIAEGKTDRQSSTDKIIKLGFVGLKSMDLFYKTDSRNLGVSQALVETGHATIYEGMDRRYNKTIAIKMFKERVSDEAFNNEVKIMASCVELPNIVRFEGYCMNPRCLLMQYMPKGSLYDVLHNQPHVVLHSRFQERIIRDVCNGLDGLHKKGFIHWDVKSSNVLLDSQDRASLSDFGLSASIEKSASLGFGKDRGTWGWMASELFFNAEYSSYGEKADIYSLGVVVWEIVTRQKPCAEEKFIEEVGDDKTVTKVSAIKTTPNGDQEDIPKNCPKKMASLIAACWKKDPKQRPSASEIVCFLESKQDNFATFLPVYRSRLQKVRNQPESEAAQGEEVGQARGANKRLCA